jgi:hypothetical protein
MSSNNQRSEEIVAVLRQALEALQRCEGRSKADEGDRHRAITSLRQSIAGLEKQEPVAWIEGEEIYWHEDGGLNEWIRKNGTPLYTHPYIGQPRSNHD